MRRMGTLAGLLGVCNPQQLDEGVVEGVADVGRALSWMTALVGLAQAQRCEAGTLQGRAGLSEEEDVVELGGQRTTSGSTRRKP